MKKYKISFSIFFLLLSLSISEEALSENLLREDTSVTTKLKINNREIDIYKIPTEPALLEWKKSGISTRLIDLNLISIPIKLTEGSGKIKYPILDIFNISSIYDQKILYESNNNYSWTYHGYDYLLKPTEVYEIKVSPNIQYLLKLTRKYSDTKLTYKYIILPKVDWETSNKILKKQYSTIYSKEDINFWSEVRNSDSDLILTEGMKKSLSLLSNNLLSISLPGSCKGFDFITGIDGKTSIEVKKELLMLLPKRSKNIYISFDTDSFESVRTIVWSAAYKLGLELEKLGFRAKIIIIPKESKTKGLDDYISRYGIENYKNLINSSVTPNEFKILFPNKINIDTLLDYEGCNNTQGIQFRYYQTIDYFKHNKNPGYKSNKPLFCE